MGINYVVEKGRGKRSRLKEEKRMTRKVNCIDGDENKVYLISFISGLLKETVSCSELMASNGRNVSD
jgi:hypothetical protein